ncbi:Pkinase-domain-containing protein [Laetiporus sulphureus 93-53]|uniref:Pkinase-domain-containing protein n=1 Tax=Laetiporus sulphureus 93-53 TaxID=1314785 RepID=A0A165DY41_9APHY|nr:Pkinase-domain-containing protein [Laetiporus sulphureus 93-53]KZT05856.1 Pkinase-domain-containing protein [Laetiporus sulphureus 93-53]
MSEARSADDDDDSEDDSLFWAVPPQKSSERSQKSSLKTNARPALARLSIDGTPSISSSSATPQNPDTSKQPPPNFPAPPSYIPPPPPLSRRTNPRSANATRKPQADRTSRFDRDDDTWAPRPPPEDVYDRLDQFFPEHDLDHPVIEMPSGGSSPTSTDNPAPAPHRSRHKKSIRVVAEERKNWIDRNSRLHNSSGGANLWKRNTKLWDSKLEEVTTQLAKADIPPLPQDTSPSVQTRPIFRWVRGQLIGKGTYGKVYLALNATTGDMIAVKQVEMPRTASDKSDTRQISVVEALKLESETLKDLDHPNIVQYLGFEETPTFLSIFLEYVPGGSIASCLRKYGSFDEDVTKSFTGQILDGLDYLHSKGILHRDLKADNILVETTGICKISDFGISKRTEDVNVIGEYTSMQGSVFWMAPEVINSQQRGYNSKIDIWSVGCVVYEMWTGERPWNGQEAVAVLIRLYQTKEAPPVPNDICLSPLADDFRRKCFAMNPDERPSAAELRKHSYLELQPGWTFNSFKQPD